MTFSRNSHVFSLTKSLRSARNLCNSLDCSKLAFLLSALSVRASQFSRISACFSEMRPSLVGCSEISLVASLSSFYIGIIRVTWGISQQHALGSKPVSFPLPIHVYIEATVCGAQPPWFYALLFLVQTINWASYTEVVYITAPCTIMGSCTPEIYLQLVLNSRQVSLQFVMATDQGLNTGKVLTIVICQESFGLQKCTSYSKLRRNERYILTTWNISQQSFLPFHSCDRWCPMRPVQICELALHLSGVLPFHWPRKSALPI